MQYKLTRPELTTLQRKITMYVQAAPDRQNERLLAVTHYSKLLFRRHHIKNGEKYRIDLQNGRIVLDADSAPS